MNKPKKAELIAFKDEISKIVHDYFEYIETSTDLFTLHDYQAIALFRIRNIIEEIDWDIKKAQDKLTKLGYPSAAKRVKYLHNYEQNEPEDWSNHPDDEPMKMHSLKMLVDFLKEIEPYEPKNKNPAIGMSYDGTLGMTYYCEGGKCFDVHFDGIGVMKAVAIVGQKKDGKNDTKSLEGMRTRVAWWLRCLGAFDWEPRKETNDKT